MPNRAGPFGDEARRTLCPRIHSPPTPRTMNPIIAARIFFETWAESQQGEAIRATLKQHITLTEPQATDEDFTQAFDWLIAEGFLVSQSAGYSYTADFERLIPVGKAASDLPTLLTVAACGMLAPAYAQDFCAGKIDMEQVDEIQAATTKFKQTIEAIYASLAPKIKQATPAERVELQSHIDMIENVHATISKF